MTAESRQQAGRGTVRRKGERKVTALRNDRDAEEE